MKTYLLWRDTFSHRITGKFNIAYLKARFDQFKINVTEIQDEADLAFGGGDIYE
jgi:hypothetical protein